MRGSGPEPEREPGSASDRAPATAPAPALPSGPERTGVSLHQPEQTRGPASAPEPGQVHAPGLQPPHGPDSETTPAHGPGSATPHLPWSLKPLRESPTPAYLYASRVAPPPGSRQPEDVRDAIPPQPSPPTPTPTKEERAKATPTSASPSIPSSATGPPPALNASTELASQTGPEPRSPAPVGNSSGVPPHRPGVSLARSEAVTELRPAPGPGHAPGGRPHSPMPPGEFPGPAVPAERPRRGRRRTGKVAAVGIVAAGAVVAVVLATNPGSPEDDEAGSSPSRPSSAVSSPGAGSSSRVEGTSRPQSLPPGSRREAGGFAWVPPEDWRRDVQTGSEVHYTSPDGEQELAAKSSLARDDLMDSWQKSEENAQRGRQYRKVRLERTTFRGHPAVVWEYTFTLQGDPWHAQLLGFTVDGRSYQINTWYRPDIETGALKTYERVKDTFTVL